MTSDMTSDVGHELDFTDSEEETRVAASRCPACDVGIHRECMAETDDGCRCPCACLLEDD